MNIIKYVTALFVCVALIQSCADTEVADCKYENNHSLISTNKIIQLPLPDEVYPYSTKLSFIDGVGNSGCLYYLDRKNNFLKYNLEKESLINKLSISRRGPNGFGRVVGFKVLKPDSILITPCFLFELGVMDSLGQKVKSVVYNANKKFPRTRDNNDTHIFIKGNNLYMPMCLEGNWSTMPAKQLKKYKTTLKCDILTGESKLLGMQLPYDDNKLRLKRHFNYSSKFKDDYVLCFADDPCIYLTSDFIQFKKYSCESPNVRNIREYKYTSNFNENLYNSLVGDQYANLIWDPYRNYLYRFYKLGNKKISVNDNLMDMIELPSRFGVMVLDSDLNVIADRVFNDNIYNWSDCFVNKEGLYISLNHPNNESFDISFLQFELFTVTSKQKSEL